MHVYPGSHELGRELEGRSGKQGREVGQGSKKGAHCKDGRGGKVNLQAVVNPSRKVAFTHHIRRFPTPAPPPQHCHSPGCLPMLPALLGSPGICRVSRPTQGLSCSLCSPQSVVLVEVAHGETDVGGSGGGPSRDWLDESKLPAPIPGLPAPFADSRCLGSTRRVAPSTDIGVLPGAASSAAPMIADSVIVSLWSHDEKSQSSCPK
eukprot:2891865-Rhodomonas_salina.2